MLLEFQSTYVKMKKLWPNKIPLHINEVLMKCLEPKCHGPGTFDGKQKTENTQTNRMFMSYKYIFCTLKNVLKFLNLAPLRD